MIEALYTINTEAGEHTGTLPECCAWQVETLGGLVTLTCPDGLICDLNDIDWTTDLPLIVEQVEAEIEAERAESGSDY